MKTPEKFTGTANYPKDHPDIERNDNRHWSDQDNEPEKGGKLASDSSILQR
jgi:hypothetical protein